MVTKCGANLGLFLIKLPNIGFTKNLIFFLLFSLIPNYEADLPLRNYSKSDKIALYLNRKVIEILDFGIQIHEDSKPEQNNKLFWFE